MNYKVLQIMKCIFFIILICLTEKKTDFAQDSFFSNKASTESYFQKPKPPPFFFLQFKYFRVMPELSCM